MGKLVNRCYHLLQCIYKNEMQNFKKVLKGYDFDNKKIALYGTWPRKHINDFNSIR